MDLLVVSLLLTVAGVFAVAVAGKVRRHAFGPFVASVRDVGVPARLARPVAVLTVAAEAAVVPLCLLPGTAAAGAALAAALLSVFTVAIARVVRRGNRVACHCFGNAGGQFTGVHVARNAVLAGVAVTAAALVPSMPVDHSGAEVLTGAFVAVVLVAGALHFVEIVSLFTGADRDRPDHRLPEVP